MSSFIRVDDANGYSFTMSIFTFGIAVVLVVDFDFYFDFDIMIIKYILCSNCTNCCASLRTSWLWKIDRGVSLVLSGL